ncbi:MAG: hypothetical protein IMF19_04590 [Proteobacteria bacterium]|nr:hypothetical protein [Pseudomonadota bacterium]
MNYLKYAIELAKIHVNSTSRDNEIKGKELTQSLNVRKVEYKASLDVSADRSSLAVFIKPNFRDYIQFDKEAWQVILELPITLVWDMLRNNLVDANFKENEIELIRRKNEALAAEKYLEEYEKT